MSHKFFPHIVYKAFYENKVFYVRTPLDTGNYSIKLQMKNMVSIMDIIAFSYQKLR